MKKIIKFTIVAIIAFSWFITHNTTEPEKVLPANAPFIIKSNVPCMCKVSAITTSSGINQNLPIVACKVQSFLVN
ncbi:hypothetical protein [Enterobacter roggenkampii]|uniref:hypothetical protein n=1 Tax=Enterobacter roggenkampii TaxID=1812935 RepID=UPI0018C24430|nr:hypothetical protein [Enterobacter roggenkampii]MBG0662412.1 hypothetical protein [Enterobacter roggenkampii]